jgi:hypothetical protein
MGETIDRYDDANFTLLREERMPSVQAGVSLVDFAHFMSRNKVIVHAVHVRIASAASVAGGSLVAVRSRSSSAKTINSYSLTSATSAGSQFSITLASLNTITSLNDYIGLRLKSNDKGKWDVTYEYQILPPTLLKIP